MFLRAVRGGERVHSTVIVRKTKEKDSRRRLTLVGGKWELRVMEGRRRRKILEASQASKNGKPKPVSRLAVRSSIAAPCRPTNGNARTNTTEIAVYPFRDFTF